MRSTSKGTQHGWFILIAVTKLIFFLKFASRSQTFTVSNTKMLRQRFKQIRQIAQHCWFVLTGVTKIDSF